MHCYLWLLSGDESFDQICFMIHRIMKVCMYSLNNEVCSVLNGNRFGNLVILHLVIMHLVILHVGHLLFTHFAFGHLACWSSCILVILHFSHLTFDRLTFGHLSFTHLAF